jgi:hypothetical protein
MICNVLLSFVLAVFLVWVDSHLKPSQATLQDPSASSRLVFHDHPPSDALAPTLDPSEFHNDRASFVVYSLAARVKDTLYQVPCYCPCHKQQGHQSLLDCYVGRHGIHCAVCQKEVLFCYHKTRSGAKPDHIREAISRGEAWKIDISRETERLYPKLTQAKRKHP